MKKLLVILFSTTLFASCEKCDLFDKDEKPCEIVAVEKVPASVVESFKTKYPAITVDTWFNKDNTGYAAAFTKDNNDMLSLFDNNGNFQSEENEDLDDDNNDNNEDEEGCECETEDED